MVILSYKQDDKLEKSKICLELTPTDVSYIGDAIERFLQLADDLNLSQMYRFSVLGDNFRTAERVFIERRNEWRKEGRS